MKTFITGNVIRSPYGSIEIVIKAEEDYIACIPIDSSNVTIGHTREDKHYNKRCYCGGDTECECKGTGEYIQTILGFDKAEYLASNIKEYIVKNVLNSLGLK